MTFSNHPDGIQKLLYMKEYNDTILLSFNDLISSFTVGLNFESKQEIAKSILLIYNIDYRYHPQFINSETFVQKKSIIEHLSSFSITKEAPENEWKEFLEVVEMESIIYKKTINTSFVETY